MPKLEEFIPTKNKRGVMHPLSSISQEFILFSAKVKKPVADIGCAFGNTVVAAIKEGAKTVIAGDMEPQHLEAVRVQLSENEQANLVTKLGVFPSGFDFQRNSLSAIHASHLFEYLTGDEVEQAISTCYDWLESGGKFFLLTYTIYIFELVNKKFELEFKRRCEQGIKWPGYLVDIGEFSSLPEKRESIVPKTLHFYELSSLVNALKTAGFIIELANYLDGKSNGAYPETLHESGRECLGIIAIKP